MALAGASPQLALARRGAALPATSRAHACAAPHAATRAARLALRAQRRRCCAPPAASGKGDGPLGAWLDLASLVTSGSKAPGVSDFAREVGSEVYVDIAGWHLFLRDMKFEVGVANAIASRAASNGGKISEDDVVALLKKVAVKLGGGRTVVSLHDVMPDRCVQDLVDISQRFARDL